ncbi:aminotransferase class I/II-fold pyridoxal phosphate-dependent enzyme [Methanohalophilus portucalensis FDF-1]|uniref:Aminotransferase n=3 Tax=Methanohalophilus portucalensis TaxID=39664 RepID=A0A1X7N8V3_9EURY|nr:aromatic amino acid aminotransferase [Methanohalophilus portucalensis]RNI13408.1 aminotransferase class I/II-fold pyridoxal phosphate-dependent enzyme [Methanohalophilus portucalensis FDF-1]SMH33981.1 aminotransferase [Methanohalophilus portucalensis FDF-1]
MTDTSRFVASYLDRVPPSGIRRFFDMVSDNEDIISLGVGEPDYITPWHIREACIHSLEQGETSYTSNYGLVELRDEISRMYTQKQGLYYDPTSEILVTSGVSEALDLAVRAITDPGDEIIIVEPSYVAYAPAIIFAGGNPVAVQTCREDEFKLTSENLKKAITPKTKAILLNYPNNPTGAVMDKKELEPIADIVEEHDIMVISDEVYERMTYDTQHTCFASLDGMRQRTIVLNGFSKAYSMTGFRMAYALAPAPVLAAMMRIHQYSMLCAPITAQVGAIEALKNGEEEVEKMVNEYNRRRRLIVKGFNNIGLECFNPGGAFYAFPSVASTGLTSEQFAERLLEQQQVVTIPGDVFGRAGNGYLRCAYAASREDIKEALERIETFISNI